MDPVEIECADAWPFMSALLTKHCGLTCAGAGSRENPCESQKEHFYNLLNNCQTPVVVPVVGVNEVKP